MPPLLFLTDPERTPEPWLRAERLPSGAGVVFRAFGAPDALETGRRLAEMARARGVFLLVGADPDLADALEADGLHLPERDLARGPALRARRPDWLITGAAHSADALRAGDRHGLDAALLSPVFPSASPSAGEALGVERFSDLVREAALPVYALGGLTAGNAAQLADSGGCGLAAVGALAER